VAGTIIAFSGLPQTGKTTFAKRLADHRQSKFLSFGDFVRHEAISLGLDERKRKDLQDLGQRLVETDVNSFCKKALQYVNFSLGEALVIDGIRHVEALAAIRTLCRGQAVKLIHLYAPIEARAARSANLEGINLAGIDAHRVESQTNNEVLQSADVVIDASGDADQVFQRITDWVKTTIG
jgi:cytidylate kinase